MCRNKYQAKFNLIYFGKGFACDSKIIGYSDESQSVKLLNEKIYLETLHNCKPDLTRELKMGINDLLVLEVKNFQRKKARLQLFYGHKPIDCKSLKGKNKSYKFALEQMLKIPTPQVRKSRKKKIKKLSKIIEKINK